MENTAEFQFEGTVLTKYTGPGGDVVIPEEVTAIGIAAFCECERLNTVTIPERVTSIEEVAFFRCGNLSSVTILGSSCAIGRSAFAECQHLTALSIPSTSVSLGNEAFSGCRGLSDDRGMVIVQNVLYNYFGSEPKVVIPNGVKVIEDRAFYNREVLTDVVIPGSITTIGDYAFAWCGNLTGITVPNSVTLIGKEAFSGCPKLATLTLPDSVSFAAEAPSSFSPNPSVLHIVESVQSPDWKLSRYCKHLRPDVLYAPGKRLDQIDPLKIPAAIGYAEMVSEGRFFSEDLENEYQSYIKRQRKKLYPLTMDYPGLLRYMMTRKLIPAADLDTLLKLADDQSRADLKAELLEYGDTALVPKRSSHGKRL